MKKYLVYDGRACFGDTNGPTCLTVSDTLEEAIEDTNSYGECAIYSYDVKDESLINEQHICNATDGVRL